MAEFETVPPFLLKSKMPPPAEIRRIQVVRYVTVAGVNEKRVQYLPQIVDEDEPEFACRVYFDFLDACVPAKLSCGTGTLKFATFSNLLQGAAAEKWQSALDEDGQAQNSNAAFLRVVRIWISKYVDSTACNDMKEYLVSAKKVYSMTVVQTAERLKVLAKYMRLLPEAPNDGLDPVYSDTELKTAFHRLMLPAWRTALMQARAGRAFLNDDDYTLANMVEFYKVMESGDRTRRAQDTRNSRGGRGFGRSPRGGRGGRGGRFRHDRSYNNDRYVSRRRPYEGDNYGSPAQRPRYADNSGGGYPGYRPAPAGRSSYSRGAPGTYGRGRGRGRSSGRSGGRGRSESHAIQAPPVTEQDDTVEEAPQEEEEHYHQEYEHPRRGGQHWVDEHFGHYDNEYGYDEDYHVDEQYDY